MGATVLHEDAIFPVRKEGIPINIRNTNAPEDKGTLIVEATCRHPKYTITGIAGKQGFASITIEKAMMNSEVGFGRKVLQVFEDNHISFEHMPSGIDTMTVFVHQSEFEETEQKVLAGIHHAVQPDSIELESDLALIAVVGRGMRATRGTAGRIFSALAHANVNVKMIDQGSSELNIVIGVRNHDFENAIKAIYDIFVTAKTLVGKVNDMNIMFFLKPKSEVAHIYDDDTVRQVLERMEYHRYSCIPMLNRQGKYVGSITEGDLLWWLKGNHNLNLKLAEMVSIQEVGRRLDYKTGSSRSKNGRPNGKAMEQNFVPVVDDQGNFSGIITRKDIIGYFYDKLVVSDKEK